MTRASRIARHVRIAQRAVFSSRAARLALISIFEVALWTACGPGLKPLPPAPPPPVSEPAPPPAEEPIPDVAPPADPGLDGRRIIRVALLSGVPRVTIGSTADWRLFDSGGESVLLRAAGGTQWSAEPHGGLMRAVDAVGTATAVRPGPLVARPAQVGGLLTVNGRRYRGEVVVTVRDSALLVVNRLGLEDYLRGVVPLEIGPRIPGEEAAVQAQAIAARSYALVRSGGRPERPYDVVATVMDQVYGGADAETPIADDAVRATAGLVLMYGGRVVNAPYHSTCGGTTAEVTEVWQRSIDQPFLKRVSDRIPGSEGYYCDPSPRFRWTKTFQRAQLAAALDRYLREYATVPRGTIGAPRAVQVQGRTPSGRVAALVVRTTRARHVLRGNDIRFVMRVPGGEILNSTYFSVDAERASDGALARVTFTGGGYGHGIGMCQWGAIGRARAGHDVREILGTYYPGTTVAALD